MLSQLSCYDCHVRLEPKTSYVRPVDRGWHYLCVACYALTDAGRVVPLSGFQLFAIGWVDREGYASVGSERASREYIEGELERHRAIGALALDIKYEIIEVPGNVEVRWDRSAVACAQQGFVQVLAARVGTLGDDVRAHDDDPPPVCYGSPPALISPHRLPRRHPTSRVRPRRRDQLRR